MKDTEKVKGLFNDPYGPYGYWTEWTEEERLEKERKSRELMYNGEFTTLEAEGKKICVVSMDYLDDLKTKE